MGLRPRLRWGAYSAPPGPLAGFNGASSKCGPYYFDPPSQKLVPAHLSWIQPGVKVICSDISRVSVISRGLDTGWVNLNTGHGKSGLAMEMHRWWRYLWVAIFKMASESQPCMIFMQQTYRYFSEAVIQETLTLYALAAALRKLTTSKWFDQSQVPHKRGASHGSFTVIDNQYSLSILYCCWLFIIVSIN